MSEAVLASLPNHIHPEKPPPAAGGPLLDGAVLAQVAPPAPAHASALKRDRSKDGSRTVKTLPFCRHTLYSECLLPWLRQQGLDAFCPLCKTAVFSQSA
ncbi:hypothetical protein WJX81_000312 [Elliptochloris bilobata]|uniref:RING-type domain-containing protein n=1 Tax=Elliptochloris bilobata TaxID=381761 RepID=A0AAW1SGZ4_9CHLO